MVFGLVGTITFAGILPGWYNYICWYSDWLVQCHLLVFCLVGTRKFAGILSGWYKDICWYSVWLVQGHLLVFRLVGTRTFAGILSGWYKDICCYSAWLVQGHLLVFSLVCTMAFASILSLIRALTSTRRGSRIGVSHGMDLQLWAAYLHWFGQISGHEMLQLSLRMSGRQ